MPNGKSYRSRVYLPERDVFSLGEMENPEDLLQLASCFYSDTERKKGVVKAIIEEVHSHTLAVEMTAKLMEDARTEPELTLFEIQRGGVAYSYNDKVTITKDGRSYNDSYYGHISGLFGLRNLTPEQLDVMSCMSLVPFEGIPLRLFAEWMDMEDTNALKEMVELGLIQAKPGNRIALHPMMWDVALADATPGVTRCKVMLEGIRYRLESHNFNEWETLFGIVCNTVEFADKDDGEFFLPFLWDVFLCMERHGYESGMDTLLPSLEWLIADETLRVSIDRDEIRRKIADYAANADHSIRDAQWTFLKSPSIKRHPRRSWGCLSIFAPFSLHALRPGMRYSIARTENAPGCRWARIPKYRKGGLLCLNTPTRSRTPFRSPNRISAKSGK